MAKLSNKTKIVALSAVVASTGVIAYASNEASKKDAEQNVDTANLIVEKISKNRVKISVDNVGESAKAFQLSLKIDGNVKFNEDNINWLVSKKKGKAVETDYLLSKDKKEIDIFVASDSELDRQGGLLEVCEIDLDNAGIKSDSSYKIVPNMDNDKIAYKSIDVNNNQVEVANMTYDDTNILSMNTPPKIALKSLENSETTTLDTNDNIDNDITVDVNDDVEIDTKNNVIKVKEGYDFNKNAKLFVEVSDEEDKNIGEDNISVEIVETTDDNKGNKPPKELDIDTSKSGSYNLKYKVTDSSNESAELNVILVIEPEVWKDEPTISGVPKNKVDIYTGQIFDPNMPDGENEIKAVDAKGNALEIDIDYSDNFNIDEAGEYTITYTAKDRFNNKKSETMNLTVIKDEAPEITGIEDKTINKGESFDEMAGVKATGNGQDLTSQITVSGKVNTNIAKEYPLTYRVSNERKTTTKTRKITVNGAPTITGDLSDITIKNGTNLTEEDIKKDILGRINISDDIDKTPKVKVDLPKFNISVDGKYKAIVTAEDSRGLTTKKQINVIVSSKTIVDLDGSGDGTTESTSIKKKVVDKSAIDEINDKLNSLMDKYDVKVNQSTLSDEVIYKIKVSSKPMAFMGIEEEFFVDITVPKAINDETGGIIEPDSNYKKVSSITINGYNKPLKVGESITLTTTINPSDAKYKDLAWQYRKDKIELRHHDNGSVTITALEDGLSTVRALATDGSKVYEEVLIQVGSNTQIDEEAPVIIYDGKTDIKIVNGMDFKIPNVIATDNVDTYTKVEATIFDPNGKEIDKIDTTKAGTYKIKYTTRDKAGNEAELIINVTVEKPISGIDVGAGDAISEETALELESTTVTSLDKIVKSMEKEFDVNVTGKPEIDNGKAIYTVKLVKKQGLIAKLFKLNKNVETYYLKITVENKKEFTDILDQFNTGGTITPPISPNPPTTPKPPTSSPSVPSTSVTRLVGERRADTAAKISKEGWTTSTNVILVNGDNKHLVDGLTASPLASAKDAPILLSNNDRLPQETIDEIKRLKASNVIVVGGESAVPQSVIEQVKAIGKNIKVQRIDGLNRYETSLNIAKEIDKTKDITKVFIGAGDGEADSLSISSVAGKDISPIILSNKDGLDKNTFDYLKDEKLTDAYFIGGDSKLSDNIISQVNAITSNDVSKNRIAGERRQDTNAKVIEKFYPSTQLKGIVVAKDLELVDALTVGPLATKKDIPVVIATDNLSKAQEDVLTKKKSPKIYEVGGGIKSSVVDKLKELLNNKK